MALSKVFDVVVVGYGGAIGAAAIYQLSKKTKNILGLDQFNPPHVFGSSHGETRVTRLAIGEGKFNSPFAIRSHEIWQELQWATGLDLLNQVGVLIMASQSSNASLHDNSDFLGETINAAKFYGIKHSVLSASQIQRKYPQFNLIGDESGYFEPEGGFLRPENCIKAQLLLAENNGAELHNDEKVLEVVQFKNRVIVKTNFSEYVGKKVVLTIGSWISKFLPQLSHLFQIQRQVLYWFDVEDHSQYEVGNFPVFIWLRGDGFLYGFPVVDRSSGIKVATEESELTDPDDYKGVSREECTNMHKFALKFLPDIKLPIFVKKSVCKYTMTPDSQFIIDYYPRCENIIIASPCSGHGFKHSAAIGEAIAQLALKGKTTLNISYYSLSRFNT